jgi:hypothetical protein
MIIVTSSMTMERWCWDIGWRTPDEKSRDCSGPARRSLLASLRRLQSAQRAEENRASALSEP